MSEKREEIKMMMWELEQIEQDKFRDGLRCGFLSAIMIFIALSILTVIFLLSF